MRSENRINPFLANFLQWGTAALIVAVPLFYAPWFLFPFVFGKAILIHLGVEILLIVWFILALRDRSYLPTPSLLTWTYLLFVGWMLLASSLGINFERSFWSDPSRMTGLFTLFHVAALALIVERICRNGFRDMMMRVLGASGTVVAVFGFALEFLARQGEGIYTGYRGRIVGTLGNPIYFAVFLAPIIFITAELAWSGRSNPQPPTSRLKPWLWRAALLVQILALAFAGSRSGLVGLVLGVVAALAVMFAVRRGEGAWAQAALVLGTLVLVVGGLLLAGRLAGDRLPPQIQKLVLFVPGEITTQTRLVNWRIAYRGWQARPWTGWGAENYRDAFDRHFDPKLLRFSLYETISDKPHNALIELLVDGGAGAFLIYLLVVVMAIRAIIQAARTGKRTPRAAALLVGAFAAYWGAAAFAFDSPSSLTVFGVLLGIAGSTMTTRQLPATSLHRLRTFVFGGAILTLLALSPYGNILPLRSLRDANKAGGYAERNAFKWFDAMEQALGGAYPYHDEIRKLLTDDFLGWQARGNFPATFAPQSFRALAEAMRDSAAAHPEYFTWRFLLSQLDIANTEEGNADALVEARAELEAARAISPRHQAVFMLGGRLALLERDFDRAISELKGAVALDPEASQPHWFLGLVYSASGAHDNEAIEEFETARRLGKSFESADEVLLVAELYAKRKDYPQLVEVFIEAIRVDPDHAADWYARLAATYGLMGERDKAAEAAREAVARDPSIGKEAQEFLKTLQ